MANDIPDFMRGFDIDEDWGFTAVPDKPSAPPAIDPEKLDTTNVEVAKVKQSVDDIKARMGEIMQISLVMLQLKNIMLMQLREYLKTIRMMGQRQRYKSFVIKKIL